MCIDIQMFYIGKGEIDICIFIITVILKICYMALNILASVIVLQCIEISKLIISVLYFEIFPLVNT